ncbi:MAG: Mu-like prophage I protein [Syntrophus sp. PtaB.Bin001]|nr:MAG: Mu-like prophage I protein [Syntrophus sp. PtaB.Bin001]
MKFVISLNSEDGMPRGIALNIELRADGTVPEWIQLLPAGTEVKGRDGRTWINDRPDVIIAAFAAEGKDLPIDWEHASELKAPNGDQAPAAGWMKEMELREGAPWVRVEWTARAVEQIRNREYRYISPVFVYEKESLRIVRITSAGLTNQPNLHLAALNNEQTNHDRKEKEPMELAQLLAALGLPATATFAEALNSINTMKQEHATALNRADNPPLDKFVPRADYDKAVERATNAEQALNDRKAVDLETAINAEIDAALKAGKITPATVDYHKAQCKQEGGLERFKQYVAAAPVIGGDTNLDGKDPNNKDKALNAEEKDVIAKMGISEDEYKKYNP